VTAATYERYSGDLRRYVIPRIGSVQLQALTAAMLDELYDELERAGGRGGRPLSAKTAANVAGALHKALVDAVKRGRIKRSPADAVSPPTPSDAHTSWWPIEELRTFLRFVEEDEPYAAWLLFATTGARAGEVAGLTWPDLDLDAGWMRVDWTLGHVGHTLTWKPRPKSRAGERTMALDPATLAALRQRKRVQAEARLLAGPAWQDAFTDWQGLARSALVWTYGDGSPVHPKTLYERFVRLSAEAGLPRIRLHDYADVGTTTMFGIPTLRSPSLQRAGGTTSRSSASGSGTARWRSRSTRTRTSCRPPTSRSHTPSRA
jgi:integrase